MCQNVSYVTASCYDVESVIMSYVRGEYGM